MSNDVTALWRVADAAAPTGWQLQGLRCSSTGLAPADRSEGWVAEACGPHDGCILVEEPSAERALRALAAQLRTVGRAC